jgi:hypothetical protein
MCSDGDACAPSRGESDMGNQNGTAQHAEAAALAITRRELAALSAMSVGELAEKYRELFGVPTRTRNKDYLRRRIAWHIQEQREGGLSPRALERIAQLAPQAPPRWRERGQKRVGGDGKIRARDPRLPVPGSILTRIHGGEEHLVTVLTDGFEYRGTRYASLSQIASLVTGTPWNGFRFFFGNSRGRRAFRSDGAE